MISLKIIVLEVYCLIKVSALLGSVCVFVLEFVLVTYDWAILNINWPCKLFQMLPHLFDLLSNFRQQMCKVPPHPFYLWQMQKGDRNIS